MDVKSTAAVVVGGERSNDGGRGGVCGGDVLRHLAGVQGVDELPHGGAVRAPAREGHGAADDGGGVSCGRVAGYAAGNSIVVWVLWCGAGERGGVRGQDGGAVP